MYSFLAARLPPWQWRVNVTGGVPCVIEQALCEGQGEENSAFTDSFSALGFTPPVSKFRSYNIPAVTDPEVTIAATGRAAPLGPGVRVSITLKSDGSSTSAATPSMALPPPRATGSILSC